MNMNRIGLLGAAAAIACVVSAEADAQLLHATFDGTAAPGQFHEHDTCKPVDNPAPGHRCIEFVEGVAGQAVHFGQYSGMFTPLNLDPRTYPQISITAWVRQSADATGLAGGTVVAAIGSNTPFLQFYGGALSARAGRETVRYVEGIDSLTKGEWTFVAGVWDFGARTLRLRSGASEALLTDLPMDLDAEKYSIAQTLRSAPGTTGGDPQPFVLIGSNDIRFFGGTSPLAIDNVRIYGRALTESELDKLAAGVDISDGGPTGDAQSESVASAGAPAGAACATHDDCAAGTYCAVDNTCHPDSHRPKAEAGGAQGFATDWQSDYEGLEGTSSGPLDLERMSATQDRVDEVNEDIQGFSDTESIGEGLQDTSSGPLDLQAMAAEQQAAEEQAVTDEAAATAAGGVQSGSGLRTVRQHLEAWDLEAAEPTGDVRDCRSFAEVTGEVAANTRDDIVFLAGTGACAFLDGMVWTTAAAVKIADATHYEYGSFKYALLDETFFKCLAGTESAAQLPDKGITFWNDSIASDNWATIGPRSIRRKIPEEGNLVSPGDRKYLTVSPLMDQDNVTLVLDEGRGDEPGGKARVTARVCKISMDNRYTLLKTFSVNETPGERDNEFQKIIWDLSGVKGHHLSIVLDASGMLGRHFKYTIKIE